MRMKLKLLALAASAGGLAALLPVQQAAAQPAANACGVSLRAEADADSFEIMGGPEGAARDRAVQQTAASFATVATRLCASRVMTAANLRPYSRLLLRSAAAATEPNVYDDAEEARGALILEFAFENAVPTAAQIEHGLRCWRNPQGQGCAVEDIGP
jgi:hypothetical protein